MGDEELLNQNGSSADEPAHYVADQPATSFRCFGQQATQEELEVLEKFFGEICQSEVNANIRVLNRFVSDRAGFGNGSDKETLKRKVSLK